MYTSCIFCHRTLEPNAAIESFPIGRRLAFDPMNGRLWVVCGRCGRWNLSPLEERWEAVEECDRLFRATRLRVSTDNIGLARISEGTELVRIGRPQRSELAAWRYGAQFGKRHKRTIIHVTAGFAISIPLLATGAYGALAAAVPGGAFVIQIPTWVQIYRSRRGIITKLQEESGSKMVIRGKHLRDARLLPPTTSDSSEWGLLVSHDKGNSELQGTHALRVASKLLARINKTGGGARSVQRAVKRLEHEGGSERLFSGIARSPQREPSGFVRWWSGVGSGTIDDPPGTLRSLIVADRLALEMATHEETERRALQGELSILEAAWREAEEIAAIADSLVLPPPIDEFLRKRGKA